MKQRKLLAILLAVLMLTAVLGGCAASYAPKTEAAYDQAAGTNSKPMMDAPAEAPAAPMPEEEVVMESESYVSTQGFEGGEVSDVPASEKLAEFTEKIIYSADVSLQTTEFDKSLTALEQSVTSYDGFIERSDSYGDIRYQDDGSTQIVNRYAYYTVRIPAGRFEEFLALTNGLGNVTNSSRYADNVTSQYTDYEARLDSLYTQEERLLSMLEKAEEVESLIALEERLADVRYEIESIERNLRNLDMKIGYSTININLTEVEKYTPTVSVQRTFGEKMADSLGDGWNRFVRRLQNFCIDLVYSLPGLILFLVFAGAAVLVFLKLRKKSKAKKAARAAAQAAAYQAQRQQEAAKKDTETK